MNDVGMGGALLEGDWESLCNLFASEAPDFGAQFLDHHPSNNPSLVTSSIDYNECFYYDPNNSLSDTTSYNNLLLQFSDSYQNCQFSMLNDVYLQMNNGVMDQRNHSPLASDLSANVNVHQGYNSPRLGSVEDNESDNLGSPHSPVVQVKRKYSAPDVQAEPKAKSAPKKKARVSINRGKKNIVESAKHAPENGADPGVEESSDSESKACRETSEEEIPASKELLVVSETSKGKKRASRGTATDPQSLYARKRRERINERLRILQNLVPNGTKVDISTMLEEAVHYVKFLQLQIQLLSSDELWMYAPIAYNGVDINLYKRISPFQLP